MVDPMDDEEDEEDEDEEYLDEEASDEEGWDQDAIAGALDVGGAGGGRLGAWNPLEAGLDDMPMMIPALAGGSFGRPGARRVMYRPATGNAAAGVWDDADGDTAQDTMGAGERGGGESGGRDVLADTRFCRIAAASPWATGYEALQD